MPPMGVPQATSKAFGGRQPYSIAKFHTCETARPSCGAAKRDIEKATTLPHRQHTSFTMAS